jgi:hypothetical protein
MWCGLADQPAHGGCFRGGKTWSGDDRYDRLVSDPVDARTGEIDYDLAIMLDAEDLAETGVGSAYLDEVGPRMPAFRVNPNPIEEVSDDAAGTYSVAFEGTVYPIYGPGAANIDPWGLATFALFDIVNRQLAHLDTRFFALNGGNDLFGIFMSLDQADVARRALPSKRDWPYFPTAEPDWFGAYHD